MYLKNIAIKNIGPINKLSIILPFQKNGDPKPIIFVGENGSGKTILLSQIIDGFYEIGGRLFDDIQKIKGLGYQYYKISGGINLQSGKNTGFSLLSFIDKEKNKIEYFDKINKIKKENFTDLIPNFSLSPNDKNNNQKETTKVNNESQKKKLQSEWMSEVHFYQPAYRYEEPFWKNKSFIDQTKFEDKKRYSEELNIRIHIISSTKDNKSFLLDLVLDRFVQTNPINVILWENINKILRKILKNNRCRLGIGPRGGYRISIVENLKDKKSKQILPSIDNLSLGESLLLNLFVNIIRHGGNYSKPLNQMQGIVAIDEIDVHLNTNLQNSVLPKLIATFPKIQFIVTTHSPLFLLGMEKVFGKNEFEIRNMPSGEIITTERFSEFKNAYRILKKTEKYESDLKNRIIKNKKTKIYVEGPTDIKYIKKGFELHKKKINNFDIEIIGENAKRGTKGSNNLALKNAGVFLKTKTGLLSQKVILLNDPEENIKEESLKEKLYIRKMPKNDSGSIKKGIENLFDQTVIDRAKEANPDCFKTQMVGEKVINFQIVGGKKEQICKWICKNGTKKDFKQFSKVIEVIEKILDEN